ncbi:alpha/beta hydrolase [Mycolicibacterium sp. P9-64]|uniref:alpha/beta hydrolase n=1 Tax=Mycolicibacterium sp. P9-64 TaxID=2024612 RepID=UPI0011EE1B72|nr:alpha/beta hydrolase [Mycolicibacterium sp. P9-64]
MATALVAGPALAVAATYAHDVPYTGLASAFVTPVMSWVIVVALAGGVLASYLWLRQRGRLCAALVVVAVLTVVAGSVVTARMVATVEDAGADIDLFDTFDVWSKQTATPDAEATYATFDGEPLQLSVYRPPDADSAPILVFIHGGGFVAGSRDVHGPDFRWFADRGWLTISIDYPLSSDDQHLWDVVDQQIGCALGWITANATKYGGDPTRMSLSGDSAGGNLAINTAYMAANGTLKSSCGGPRPVISAVSALYPVVDVAGFYDNTDRALGAVSRDMAGAYVGGSPRDIPQGYAAVASATHISPAAPPTLILMGADDHLVPTEGTYRFVDRARAAGVDIELVAVPYADHVFDGRTGSIGQQAYRQLTLKWLRDHGQAP